MSFLRSNEEQISVLFVNMGTTVYQIILYMVIILNDDLINILNHMCIYIYIYMI